METPDDFDEIDFALWRLECALCDAEPCVDDITRDALVIARARVAEQREGRAHGH